ncbi:MAG: peptide deformylase [Oscillospiraceae bacterium]|nr:peptide deformylase [Oscillospiraceae bacterium]
MERTIIRDVLFLRQRAQQATRADLSVGRDLTDTLRANADRCVGMAANMIGVNKRVIVVAVGFGSMVLYNPAIVKKDTPYEAEEGCLSLSGKRRTTRYQNITVEYRDADWKKQTRAFSGHIAQIIQHEIDHTNGILI